MNRRTLNPPKEMKMGTPDSREPGQLKVEAVAEEALARLTRLEQKLDALAEQLKRFQVDSNGRLLATCKVEGFVDCRTCRHLRLEKPENYSECLATGIAIHPAHPFRNCLAHEPKESEDED